MRSTRVPLRSRGWNKGAEGRGGTLPFPPGPPYRFPKIAIAACIVVAGCIAGCGPAVRFAYNNADFGLRLLAHEYLDLHDAQADAVKVQLARLHAWHRHEELPLYAEAFENAARRVARRLRREDVEWALALVRERGRALGVRTAEDAAPLLLLLDEHNIEALEKKFASNNRKYRRDFLDGGEARNERARTKRLRDRIEEWTGDLDAAQEALVAQFVRATQKSVEPQFESRKLRQREFVALLRAGRGDRELPARVRTFVRDWERLRTPEYAALAPGVEAAFVQLVLDLDGMLTTRQRERAVKKLERYAEDSRALADEGRPKAKREQRVEASADGVQPRARASADT